MEVTANPTLDVRKIVDDILNTIGKDREREIISRRFGLTGRRETLEEIGNLLGITRERVRQIEKQVLTKLQMLEHPHIDTVGNSLKKHLEELGRVAPLDEVAERLDSEDHAHINFLAHLIKDIEVINDNDFFHHSLALKKHHDAKKLHKLLKDLTATIKQLGRPVPIEEIHAEFDQGLEKKHVHGLARAAKKIDHLDEQWGLTSWPLVNPKSIRDKIYVILKKQGKPMHFSEISSSIKNSDFKRKDVTTQAIHNELIKDSRFVLVGRGIYALEEWGYNKGTVADVIEDILSKESPLHRDEIVKRVLKQRHVKPTTIILNLQGKEQFKRVAKATYALSK